MASCLNCDGGFSPQKSHGKFCSDKCRVAHHRKEKRTQKKAEKQTIPLDLLPVMATWQEAGKVEIFFSILDLYWKNNDIELVKSVSDIAWQAYIAGLKRN